MCIRDRLHSMFWRYSRMRLSLSYSLHSRTIERMHIYSSNYFFSGLAFTFFTNASLVRLTSVSPCSFSNSFKRVPKKWGEPIMPPLAGIIHLVRVCWSGRRTNSTTLMDSDEGTAALEQWRVLKGHEPFPAADTVLLAIITDAHSFNFVREHRIRKSGSRQKEFGKLNFRENCFREGGFGKMYGNLVYRLHWIIVYTSYSATTASSSPERSQPIEFLLYWIVTKLSRLAPFLLLIILNTNEGYGDCQDTNALILGINAGFALMSIDRN